MKTTLDQALKLEIEIGGLKEGKEVRVKGLLNEELNIRKKFQLDRLHDELTVLKKTFERSRARLIEKHGRKIKNTYTLDKTIEEEGVEKLNPAFVKYMEEISEILKEEVELKSPIPVFEDSDFDFKSESFYPLALQFFSKD